VAFANYQALMPSGTAGGDYNGVYPNSWHDPRNERLDAPDYVEEIGQRELKKIFKPWLAQISTTGSRPPDLDQ
jgi:hypothetical protein